MSVENLLRLTYFTTCFPEITWELGKKYMWVCTLYHLSRGFIWYPSHNEWHVNHNWVDILVACIAFRFVGIINIVFSLSYFIFESFKFLEAKGVHESLGVMDLTPSHSMGKGDYAFMLCWIIWIHIFYVLYSISL